VLIGGRRLANVREFNELTTKASTDMFSVTAQRVSEAFDDVRHYAKKNASATAAVLISVFMFLVLDISAVGLLDRI
jgi:hypothetical protein